jgi:hypothetical protein
MLGIMRNAKSYAGLSSIASLHHSLSKFFYSRKRCIQCQNATKKSQYWPILSLFWLLFVWFCRIIVTMRTTLILCLLCSCVLYTGCTVAYKDPRCQVNQFCPYTDRPSAIRTEVIRNSGSYAGDPAVR